MEKLVHFKTKYKIKFWWLVDSPLSTFFCLFASKLWEGGRDSQTIFGLSVSTVRVLSTLIGDEDTQTSNLFQLFALRGGGDAYNCSHALAFSQP